jgi:hypothetical protein
MGSYVIAPTAATATQGVLSVTYSTVQPSGGPLAGETYAFVWSVTNSGNTLNVTSVDPRLVDISTIFTRNTPSAIDGTWLYAVGGEKYIAELQANTYLSYTFLANSLSATMGTYQLSAPNKIDVYLTIGADGFAGTRENGTYAVTADSLNLQVTVEAASNSVVTLGPYVKIPNNAAFEGVYSGFTINSQNQYCLTLVEFHASLWRGYQTRCDSTYSFGLGTFLGTFEQISSAAINLTYVYTDFHDTVNPPDIVGETFTFNYVFNGDQLTLSNPSLQTTIQLTKVVTMPTLQNIEIKLSGNVTDFIGGVVDSFVSALADILGIDARNIRITGVRSGSIIVTVEIQDDAKNNIASSAANALLAGATTIDGFPVQSVTNVTPGGASNSGSQLIISWMMFLALISALLL